MCLDIDRKETRKISKLTKNVRKVFWKNFTLVPNGNLVTEFQNVTILFGTREVAAEGEFDVLSDDEIHGGVIHAWVSGEFRNDKTCKQEAHDRHICIPIIVYTDDIVAMGNNDDVCFFKYMISRDTWRKIKRISALR